MNIFDVVYTPLDTPKMPDVDVNKLLKWIDENHLGLHSHNKKLIDAGLTAEGHLGDNYPWKLTPAYFNNEIISTGWLNNFDEKFPDLSTYFYTAFGLELDDIGTIMLLPTVSHHSGLGFWHQDVDMLGLRMYLAFDDLNNKLYTRKTKIKYTERQLYENSSLESMLDPEIIDCKILHKNQCFFLNNVNAAHAIYTTNPGTTRIAAFFTEKYNNRNILISKIESLVINSANKFKEHSIIW